MLCSSCQRVCEIIVCIEISVLISIQYSDLVPNLAEKNINAVNTLRKGCFVVMRNVTKQGGRFYIGEVLDMYKKGASKRHCSIDIATSTVALSYLSLRVFLPVTLVSTSLHASQ